jgi:hypothetical protein
MFYKPFTWTCKKGAMLRSLRLFITNPNIHGHYSPPLFAQQRLLTLLPGRYVQAIAALNNT